MTALEQRPSEVASVRAAARRTATSRALLLRRIEDGNVPARSKPTKPTTGGRLASMTFSVLVSLWAGPDRPALCMVLWMPVSATTGPGPGREDRTAEWE